MQQLPEICYATLPSTGEVIIIKKDQQGYVPFDNPLNQSARELNAEIGVNAGQESAMRVGSMFGFHVPGADPALYNEDGSRK